MGYHSIQRLLRMNRFRFKRSNTISSILFRSLKILTRVSCKFFLLFREILHHSGILTSLLFGFINSNVVSIIALSIKIVGIFDQISKAVLLSVDLDFSHFLIKSLSIIWVIECHIRAINGWIAIFPEECTWVRHCNTQTCETFC